MINDTEVADGPLLFPESLKNDDVIQNCRIKEFAILRSDILHGNSSTPFAPQSVLLWLDKSQFYQYFSRLLH